MRRGGWLPGLRHRERFSGLPRFAAGNEFLGCLGIDLLVGVESFDQCPAVTHSALPYAAAVFSGLRSMPALAWLFCLRLAFWAWGNNSRKSCWICRDASRARAQIARRRPLGLERRHKPVVSVSRGLGHRQTQGCRGVSHVLGQAVVLAHHAEHDDGLWLVRGGFWRA